MLDLMACWDAVLPWINRQIFDAVAGWSFCVNIVKKTIYNVDVVKCVVIAGGCLKWQGMDCLQTMAKNLHSSPGKEDNKMHVRNAIFSCSHSSWCSLFLFTIELLLTWVSPQWWSQWKVWKGFQVSYRIYFIFLVLLVWGVLFYFNSYWGGGSSSSC